MTLEKLRRVLLVEDNLGDARLVREMLIDAPSGPFQVQTVETLVAALDALAREDRFDVVLLDLSLPDSTGLDTLLTVERHAMGVPIVLLTGLDNDSIALDAVRRGAQDYLLKGTLSPEILVRSLQYAIIRRQTGAEQSPAVKATIIGILGSAQK